MNNDSYMQAPKVLWNPDSRYFLLSNNAKIIYMLMIDRYKLSAKTYQEGNNTWFDIQKGRCFVKFSNTELGKLLGGISSKTVIKAKLELEELGLIKQFSKENDRSCYFFVFPPKEVEEIPDKREEEKKENTKDNFGANLGFSNREAAISNPVMNSKKVNNRNYTKVNLISEEEAREIILHNISGATDSDITRLVIKYENNRFIYLGKVNYEGNEYVIKLDGVTGSIIK